VAVADLVQHRSVLALQRAFREAPAPELVALVGRHEAKSAGWLRLVGPLSMSLTGMHGWWGKQVRCRADEEDSLEGENLLLRQGRILTSIPIDGQDRTVPVGQPAGAPDQLPA
jgi:hypothetical protein